LIDVNTSSTKDISIFLFSDSMLITQLHFAAG